MSFDKLFREEARLCILKALSAEPNYSLNDALLQTVLATYAINRSREWIREELRRLVDLGAVTITEAGTSVIVTATQKGIDHVNGLLVVEGVKRPSPKG